MHDRKRALKRKCLVFGATALAVAAIGSVAITPGAPSGVAAATESSGNPLIRSNVGVTTGQNGTVVSTYVVVGPGGVLYGPDGSPIPQETPFTYVNGVVGGTPSSAGPQFTISTPTPVVFQGQVDPSGAAPNSTTPSQRYFIGALDAPAPTNAPTPTIQTNANVITGQVNPQATIDPANNPNVVIGTPSGGVNAMGVVQANGRGK